MNKLSLAQMTVMLDLQYKLNTLSYPQWVEDAPDYLLAGAVELLGEGIEYTPWKWWKAGTLQKDRLFLELIDALHFNMSSMLVRYRQRPAIGETGQEVTVRVTADQMSINNDDSGPLEDFKEAWIPQVIKSITRSFLSESANTGMNLLLNLLYTLGYTGDDIFKSYIGKNVLNTFRQANGYKAGTYVKIWDTNPEDPQEDNDFLQKFLASSPVAPEEIYSAAYNYLTVRYQKVLGNEIV